MEGQECGAVGLRLLLERIENPRLPGMPARRIMVASRIIERRSAGPCKAPATIGPAKRESEPAEFSALVK
jgi:LacI family transcriptional regulator